MEDHHVDRPGVEAQQCAKLTGTNRSFGLIHNLPPHAGTRPPARTNRAPTTNSTSLPPTDQRSEIRKVCPLSSVLCPLLPFRRPGGHGEGYNTRSHPELGRENPQRRWYCVLRRGRVGRRQVLRTEVSKSRPHPHSCPQYQDQDPVPSEVRSQKNRLLTSVF